MKAGTRPVMTAAEVAARISELAPTFLKGLAPRELGSVLKAATLRRLRAHSVVAREGHRADEVFLLLEGRARHFTTTREGAKIVVMWIMPGEISGARALLSTTAVEYLVSTEAVIDSWVIVWGRSTIQALAKGYPRLVENALLIASGYLAYYRDLHIAASYEKADRRVAWVLQKLAEGMGQSVDGGTELKISNEELANEANVTIFTVSRLLSEWQRKSLLVKGRGKIVIRSLEGIVKSAG